MITGDLSQMMPVYVTRKTADGLTGSVYLSVWMPLLVALLAIFNGILWGVIGIVYAVYVAVSAVL